MNLSLSLWKPSGLKLAGWLPTKGPGLAESAPQLENCWGSASCWPKWWGIINHDDW